MFRNVTISRISSWSSQRENGKWKNPSDPEQCSSYASWPDVVPVPTRNSMIINPALKHNKK